MTTKVHELFTCLYHSLKFHILGTVSFVGINGLEGCCVETHAHYIIIAFYLSKDWYKIIPLERNNSLINLSWARESKEWIKMLFVYFSTSLWYRVKLILKSQLSLKVFSFCLWFLLWTWISVGRKGLKTWAIPTWHLWKKQVRSPCRERKQRFGYRFSVT